MLKLKCKIRGVNFMNNDKNNANTTSLDVNNSDSFFDDVKDEFTSDDFFANENAKVKEKNNEPNSNTTLDFSDEDIFANLNLEDNNSLSSLDNNLDSEDDSLLQENSNNDISSTATLENSNINLEDEKISLENSKNQKKKKVRKPLTKKQKITIIVIVSIITLLLVCLIVYLLLPKKTEEPEPEPTETIVIDKGNYKYQDGTLIFLNDQKTEIGSYTCEEKKEDSCYIAYTSNDEDTINVTKNVYEDGENVKIRSEIFHNRFVFINDGSKDTMKLYDILENKTIGTYKAVKYYENLGTDYVILQNEENKYGLVKITSNTVDTIINFTYDNLTSLEKKDNILVAQKGNKYYLINLDNKTLTKTISKPIYDYSAKYLVLKNNNTYDLSDYDNQIIYSDYNYISIISDEYVALVNDGSLYIRDYAKNKYNEVGYSLANENYSGLNTYSKEGILKSSSYAYKINVNNNTLTVFLKNGNNVTEKGLNLLDGKASINQKYYSSFDGILYIYSDLEKTNLLGSYVCTNKNDFTTTETFNMCALARNYSFDENFKNHNSGKTSEILPIVNNRYIFITDDINYDDAGEVKVYDLYDKKTLATYKHVSSNNANSEVTFVNNIDNIIVKNKSDKFGVISINNNGITKNYDFVYDRMERIGNYIEVARNNKYQIIFNNDSSSISLDSKIYDFSGKYFVVKNNDKFDIYSDDGTDNPKKITNKTYKVIKLVGETIYLAIDDNNKVYVNSYDNTTINNEEIILEASDNIFTLYNMVSASISGNNVILNTFKADGAKENSYTFTLPKKEEEKKDDKNENNQTIPTIKDDTNETQE